MTQDEKELLKKFWKWHKTRVNKADKLFDLDYYEVVEDVINMAQAYAVENYKWRKRFEQENLILLLRIRELQEEIEKNHENFHGLIKFLEKLLKEKKANEQLNSKAEKRATIEQ